VQPSSIKVGDQVLIRSEKKGKVALPWRANTFRVTAVKGDSILIDDGNHRLMRHSTAVKKQLPQMLQQHLQKQLLLNELVAL
jgi:hypothetical protein